VDLFDGTTVTMPDTPANQAAYPQVYNQGPGLGFPFTGEPDAFGWAGVVHHAIEGDFGSRPDLNGFWEQVLGDAADRIDDDNFARGFVDGAWEVWQAVRHKI
jgi:hypothetical protein